MANTVFGDGKIGLPTAAAWLVTAQLRDPLSKLEPVGKDLGSGQRGTLVQVHSHAVSALVHHSKIRIAYRAFLESLAIEAGAREPAALAEQLMMLVDGLIVTCHVAGAQRFPERARSAAASIVDAALAGKA